MIKSLSCNLISNDNQINNENIDINFQEFNHDNYQIEIFENDEKFQKLKQIKEKYKQFLESLIKIKNQIKELENENNDARSKNTIISNILEWITNIATISAGAVSIVPGVGTIGSDVATVTSGECAIANSVIKSRNNNEIENSKENINNFISIQIEDEINSMDLTNQPSTSGYNPNSPKF